MVEKIATCGERIDTYSELRRHVRWAYGHDAMADGPNEYGQLLLARLSRIYQGFDNELAEEQRQQALATPFQVITPENFTLIILNSDVTAQPGSRGPAQAEPCEAKLYDFLGPTARASHF